MSSDIENYSTSAQRPETLEAALAIERNRFAKVLDDAILHPVFGSTENSMNILSIGCGLSIETPVLVGHMLFSNFGKCQVNVVGIDPHESSIKIARELAAPVPGDHKFIVGDAQKLSDYPEVPKQIDMALFRRQSIGNPNFDLRTGRAIVDQAMQRVSVGGIALVTSLSQEEHEGMISLFDSLGFQPEYVSTATRYRDLKDGQKEPPRIMDVDRFDAVFYKD